MFGSKKRKEKELLNQIQKQYWKLNEVVYPIYKFENCPRCGKSIVNIRAISNSGQSIEYSCEKCDKIMACTIKDGKNPKRALKIQSSIKAQLEELYSLIGEEVHNRDIEISFDIN